MSASVNGQRGSYMTPSRADQLERRLNAMEDHYNQRLAELEREVADTRAFAVDVVRAQLDALVQTFRNLVGGRPE